MRTPSKYVDQTDEVEGYNSGFQDKYWGRCPQMLHSIPEADIWVCNPEYVWLVNAYPYLTFPAQNMSIELKEEIEDFINVIGGSRPMTPQEAALAACVDSTQVAPGNPTNFSATDTLRGRIIMTWDNQIGGLPLPKYNLWENGIEIVQNITSPYTYVIDDHTAIYHVVADNGIIPVSVGTSNTDSGTSLALTSAPDAFTIDATDNRMGEVAVTWAMDPTISPTVYFKLFEDNIFVEDNITSPYIRHISAGIRDYRIEAYNVLGAKDASDPGESLLDYGAPGAPLACRATDDQVGQVTITWVDEAIGFPAPTYSIFENGVSIASLLPAGSSPYVHIVAHGNREYIVVASNSYGDTPSNTDWGESIQAPTAPNPLTVTATDDREGEVIVSWIPDSVGFPTPIYELYVDGALLASNVASPYVHKVAAGTYNYEVRATNASGSANGLATGIALVITETALTLPQFPVAGVGNSVTLWIQSMSIDSVIDLVITNTLNQPTLKFDGAAPTSGKITFKNEGTIIGTNTGDNAVEFSYPLTLVNVNEISGAGGKGGSGGVGATGASTSVPATTTATAAAGSWVSPAHGFSFTNNTNTTVTVTNTATGAFNAFSTGGTESNGCSDLTTVTGSVGTASMIYAAGTISGLSPGCSPTLKYTAAYTYTVDTTCTVPGGPGGAGGVGGDGESFSSAATAGLPGAAGTSITACSGTVGTTGFSGGTGGTGGALGTAGDTGLDGVNNPGSGGLGLSNGLGILGNSILNADTIHGNIVGGVA